MNIEIGIYRDCEWCRGDGLETTVHGCGCCKTDNGLCKSCKGIGIYFTEIGQQLLYVLETVYGLKMVDTKERMTQRAMQYLQEHGGKDE